jgi:hypothetical protein
MAGRGPNPRPAVFFWIKTRFRACVPLDSAPSALYGINIGFR